MSDLDPEDDGVAAPTTAATDASKTPIHDAWQAWSSSPANNAALLQFGIAMLQPRSPGQTGIGAAANAVAEGGGAAGRVITAQNAEDLAASTEEDRKATTAAKTSNASSTAANAAAYGRSVDNAIANPKSGGLSSSMRIQGDYRKWLAKPEDALGLTSDPIVGAITKQFPEIKTKADLLANPAANAAAFRLFQQSVADPVAVGDAPDTGGAVTPPAAIAPPTPTTRTIYKDGKAYSWDGVNAPVPQ